jgi:hypothetical protein
MKDYFRLKIRNGFVYKRKFAYIARIVADVPIQIQHCEG